MYIKRRFVGAALGLAVLGAGARAEARIGDYSHGTGYGRSDNAGNNNYGASFSMSTTQVSKQLTSHTFDRQSYATQLLSVDTRLFGMARNVVYARTFAQAIQRVWGTDLTQPPEYVKGASVELRVMGDTKAISNPGGQSNCNEGSSFGFASFTTCASAPAYSITHEFYSNSQTFAVGPVPITVRARITGTVESVLSARAGSKRLNTTVDSPPTFRGDAQAKFANTAYLTCRQSAYAGIPEVFGLSLAATYRMIELSITPTAQASQLADKTQSTLWYQNTISTELRTMRGSLDIRFDYLVDSYEKNLLSWDGFVLSENMWGPAANLVVR